MSPLHTTFLLTSLLILYWGISSSDTITVVEGRRGSSTVLQCEGNPENPFLTTIWKFHHFNNYSCFFSYLRIRGGPQTYTNCSTRMTGTDTTLTIQNTEISDGGNYTCEWSSDGSFITSIMLQVFAQPSVSLDVNSHGSLECRAVGGFPAAEISWIPISDNITQRKTKDVNDTWTVISTYKSGGGKVTCFVSHPTFVNPWSQSIVVIESSTFMPSHWGHLLSHGIVCVLYTVLIIYIVFDWRKMENEKVKRERNITYENVIV